MIFVLDASITLSWYFADEQTDTSRAILGKVAESGAVVLPHWRFEVANGLQIATRRGRIDSLFPPIKGGARYRRCLGRRPRRVRVSRGSSALHARPHGARFRSDLMDEADRESLAGMFVYTTEAVRLFGPASEDEFLADTAKVHAICRLVQILGEAANRIPVSRQLEFPEIPWKDVIGMRHRLVHGYREVRYPVVLKTVLNDLPNLIASLERLLAESDQ